MSKKKTSTAKVFKAPVKIKQDEMEITFPAKLAEYLDLTGNEVFYTAVNGVVQFSGIQPKMVIPMLTDDEAFEPQPKEPKRNPRYLHAVVEPE
jgi:hypothetical protein